jgi:hypothetical protein
MVGAHTILQNSARRPYRCGEAYGVLRTAISRESRGTLVADRAVSNIERLRKTGRLHRLFAAASYLRRLRLAGSRVNGDVMQAETKVVFALSVATGR